MGVGGDSHLAELVAHYCDQQLAPLPAFSGDNCPIPLSLSNDFTQTLGQGRNLFTGPLKPQHGRKTETPHEDHFCFLCVACN